MSRRLALARGGSGAAPLGRGPPGPRFALRAAGAARYLEVRRGAAGPVVQLSAAPPVNFCRPSADHLFRRLVERPAPWGPAP